EIDVQERSVGGVGHGGFLHGTIIDEGGGGAAVDEDARGVRLEVVGAVVDQESIPVESQRALPHALDDGAVIGQYAAEILVLLAGYGQRTIIGETGLAAEDEAGCPETAAGQREVLLHRKGGTPGDVENNAGNST